MFLLEIMSVSIVGVTTFFLGYNLFAGQLEASAARRLQQVKKKPSSAILGMCRPLFRALVFPYSVRLKKVFSIDMEDWRKKSRRLIISAGLEEELDADELLAWKIFLGFVAPVALIIYLYVNGGVPAWWVMIGLMAVGFVYPSFWVKGRKSARHEDIRIQLPFVIDLLTLSTEAGLDFIGALQKVVEKTRSGPLVDEIERMLQEIQLGTTRAESLRNLAWRIDLSEISSLVAVLVTADQMGSPLGDVLRVQSELLRTQRFTNAEKKGSAASQKILFPLIFFIMPAVFIMIFGPVILGFFGAGRK